ncbi:MAG: Fic family protein [Bauldia sp.]|nr:Fic family protein [Bauldia sp.]
MILFEITNSEQHDAYRELEVGNGNRQYDFIRSMVVASLQVGRPFLSQTLLKALNFQAIACLHVAAGEYRPCPVTVGTYTPPDHYRVPALMEDFVNTVNMRLHNTDPVAVATFVLWRVNHIHPFINGNGRTARAAAYFVLCVLSGGILPGTVILPELLRVQNRAEYVEALREGDRTAAEGSLDLSRLHALVARLIDQQLASAINGGDQPTG